MGDTSSEDEGVDTSGTWPVRGGSAWAILFGVCGMDVGVVTGEVSNNGSIIN